MEGQTRGHYLSLYPFQLYFTDWKKQKDAQNELLVLSSAFAEVMVLVGL